MIVERTEAEECWRWALGEYADGKGKGISCLVAEKYPLCGVYEARTKGTLGGDRWVLLQRIGMAFRMKVSRVKDETQERAKDTLSEL